MILEDHASDGSAPRGKDPDRSTAKDGMGRAAKVWHFRRCLRNRWSAPCRNRTISVGPSPP